VPNPRIDILRAPDNAAAFLADHLRAGEITLLLGAGVSMGLGLPSWGDLVVACETDVGGPTGSSTDSSEGYMVRMDAVRRKSDDEEAFLNLVRTNLYGPDLIAEGSYEVGQLSTMPMLNALGALVMLSARGSVSDVFTLNFDDVLDWYLHLHGFRTQTICNLPTLIGASADVRIFHLHGYLPLNERHDNSDAIVLTRRDFVRRLAEDASAPWPALIAGNLLSKVLLVVGTSMSDIDMAMLLERARKVLGGTRTLGFVVGAGMDDPHCQDIIDAGLVPVSLDDYAALPTYLLSICQRAAEAT
jgi:hypothetical protein